MSGIAAVVELRKAGYTDLTVYEKADRVGGLLRYGIPDFKLEKWVIDRRLEQMRDEGVSFQTGVHVGVDLSVAELRKGFDAIVLTVGAEQPYLVRPDWGDCGAARGHRRRSFSTWAGAARLPGADAV